MFSKIGVGFLLVGGLVLLFQCIETMMDPGLAWHNYTIFEFAPSAIASWLQGLPFPLMRTVAIQVVHFPLFAMAFVVAMFFFVLNAIWGE